MIDKVRMGPACYHVLHVLPPMVAHEMNFFVDEGLVDDSGRPAYEIVPGGLTPLGSEKQWLAAAMREKGISIAMDLKPSTIVYLNRRGAKLSIIAGWRNHQTNWVMGVPGVQSLADLRGRLVGLKDIGSIRHQALAYWLKEAGLDPQRDVRYVRGFSDGQSALRAGQVDAAFVPSNEGETMQGEGFTKLIDLSEQSPGGRPDRIIVATNEVIEQRPDWVKAFVKGMIRSYWFVRTVPENLRYLSNLERRMRHCSPSEEERVCPLSWASPADCEHMPFPLDGVATGFEAYMQECIDLGEVDREDAEWLERSLRLDIARGAFEELAGREQLQPELERAREVARRLGY